MVHPPLPTMRLRMAPPMPTTHRPTSTAHHTHPRPLPRSTTGVNLIAQQTALILPQPPAVTHRPTLVLSKVHPHPNHLARASLKSSHLLATLRSMPLVLLDWQHMVYTNTTHTHTQTLMPTPTPMTTTTIRITTRIRSTVPAVASIIMASVRPPVRSWLVAWHNGMSTQVPCPDSSTGGRTTKTFRRWRSTQSTLVSAEAALTLAPLSWTHRGSITTTSVVPTSLCGPPVALKSTLDTR